MNRRVHRVERREVVDVGEEAGRLDDVGEGAAGGVEHGREIAQRLSAWPRRLGELAGRRIAAELAGAEHEVAGLDRLAVRPGRRGGVRADGSTGHAPSLAAVDGRGGDERRARARAVEQPERELVRDRPAASSAPSSEG
jgi:hypothetical protein